MRLSDLFAGLESGQDCVLGDAPLPGSRLVIQQPQLEAIALQFGVAWEPRFHNETVTINREGRSVERAMVVSMLGNVLAKRSNAQNSIVTLTSFSDMIVDRTAQLSIDEVSFEQPGGLFTATLVAAVDGRETSRLPLAGKVERLVRLAVPSRQIAEGDVIGDQDLMTIEVPASRVHDEALQQSKDAIGLVAARPLPLGLAISRTDLRRPNLVSRGGPVMMRLTSSGIEVAAQGQALEAGTVGDRIRVLNPVSHAILFATVTDQNEVRIDPDSTPFMRVGGGAYQTFDAGNSYAQASILHYGQAGSLNGSER